MEITIWLICWHLGPLRLPTSLKWKAGLTKGSAAVHNLFRGDINFLYLRVPENKNQSPEIKGIGLPITEPVARNSEYVKQRKTQKRHPSKKKPFICWMCFLQRCHFFTFKFIFVNLIILGHDQCCFYQVLTDFIWNQNTYTSGCGRKDEYSWTLFKRNQTILPHF